jgi:hypothetical protein
MTFCVANPNRGAQALRVLVLVFFVWSNVDQDARADGWSQTIADRRTASRGAATRRLVVPEPVASLVRPLLDMQQKLVGACGQPGTPSQCVVEEPDEGELGRLLYVLTKQQGSAADEALVVLMCFYMGESGEEFDAVADRGRRMLKYLEKYRSVAPRIPRRAYPDSMLREKSVKEENFAGALKAIRSGWRP